MTKRMAIFPEGAEGGIGASSNIPTNVGMLELAPNLPELAAISATLLPAVWLTQLLAIKPPNYQIGELKSSLATHVLAPKVQLAAD
ncbi:MAG: hypothetical protein KJ558_07370 [Gammaproteobacteria bacterium]|nr:hypothetical protein [Gammaproteobacteria bacterium]MBU1654635.1 hypothetical protein [Gammaproteobacteria bacterium]MBU1960428.1 hypothetical protein [Gammaproteobacteria bacterium]